MSNEGFNNKIGVDSKTGFVYGGNRWNCGTWMDKMGSSENAGNKGYPGSPRDGSAVELIGLSRSIINWLIQMIEKGFYPYNEEKQILEDWLKKIDKNFEKEFWIDQNSTENQFINRRNIYKDTINSSLQWTDYQFRPNFLIAAVVVSLNKRNKFSLSIVFRHLKCLIKIIYGQHYLKLNLYYLVH
jgi:glycogen debranching enzyme